MRQSGLQRRLAYCALAVGAVLGAGCGGLFPKGEPPPAVYSLDSARSVVPASSPTHESGSAPTLVVGSPRAAPGYDSQHIVYVVVAHQRQRFARSDWVDTPAHMLAPLIVAAIESTGGFRAVVPLASGITGDMRLDTEVLRLQQEFGNGPSRVRFTLGVTLSDNATQQVIAQREFDKTVAAASDDPYGGVVAANHAVQQVMQELASYCSLAVAPWRASARREPQSPE